MSFATVFHRCFIGGHARRHLLSHFLILVLSFAILHLFSPQAQASPNDDPSRLWVLGADSPVAVMHPASQQTPNISGDTAVWIDQRPNAQGYNYSRVFYRRLPEVTAPPDQQTPAEQELVANSFSQSYPAISGNLVVWQEIVSPGISTRIFYKYIDGSGPSVLSGTSYSQSHPAVSGSRVVWQDGRNGSRKSQIYMFDLNQGVEIPVSVIPGDNLQPAIDGDWVVWVKNDQYSYVGPAVNDILAKNIATGEERTIISDGGIILQEHPAISGSKVVWNTNYGTDHLCIYDLVTRQTQTIPGSEYAANASIEGNIVTWLQSQTHQILMHDLSSGITQQVSSGAATSTIGPAVSSGHIIWRDDRDGTSAIYQNKLGDRAQQLADKYAPHLYMHHEEYFEPRKVDIMVAGEGTILMKEVLTPEGLFYDVLAQSPNISMDTLFGYKDLNNDGPTSLTTKYIDLPGNVSAAFYANKYSFGKNEHLLRSDFVDRYDSLVSTNSYPETTYAHIVKDPVSGRTAIQYWLPYYFDYWVNYHEGDWEHIDVMLDGNLQPNAAAYSAHESGRKRIWDYIEGPDSHPIVYVAKGSHANYFAAGEYGPLYEREHTEVGPLVSPNVEVLPFVSSSDLAGLSESPYKWLAYQGLWGEFLGGDLGGNGPQGPAATPEHDATWDNPFNWFDNDQVVPWDGTPPSPEQASGDVMASADCPVDLHLYDSQGRHVGKNETGGIDEQIPAAEYIEIPATDRKTIIVHNGDGTAGYRFVLKGTGTGTFDLTVVSPDRTQNSSDTVQYQTVPVSSLTEAEVFLDQSRNYGMLIDVNGDGTIDSGRQPESVTAHAIDLTPPAQTTDLSVTNMTSGTATLAFTASGDNGNAGAAQYYDIRYLPAPINESNWKDALPVYENPATQPAGAQVMATASGLSAGTTYYFAIKAIDDTLQSSELSNTAIAITTIPRLSWAKQRVYWANWTDYQNRQLSIDYRMSNTGTGIAIAATVQASLCSPGSVYVTTLLPLMVGDINPGISRTVTLKYFVPTTVGNFTTTTYSTCRDDAGRTNWFPGPMS